MRDDVRVDASDITVSSDKGIVTLSGTVDNLASKKYADMEAKKINGVLSVVNKISIDLTWRPNADIRNAVRRRLLNNDELYLSVQTQERNSSHGSTHHHQRKS